MFNKNLSTKMVSEMAGIILVPAFLAVLVLLVSGSNHDRVGSSNVAFARSPMRYVYSAKYLCGFIEPLPNVFHWTDINVHNFSKEFEANINKKFVVSGTQEMLVPWEPRQESLTLGPNQAFEITCDEIKTKLGIPMSTPLEGFVEIESDQRLSVVGVYDKCTKPPRVDTFSNADWLITLHPPGGPRVLSAFDVRVKGPLVVKRGEQKLDLVARKFYIDTEVAAMALTGDSPLLPADQKTIHIVQSQRLPSSGRIYGDINTDTWRVQFPVDGFFDLFVELHFEDPTLTEQLGFLYNVEPIPLHASLSQIPPGLPDDAGTNVFQPSPAKWITLYDSKTGEKIGAIRSGRLIPMASSDPEPVMRHSDVPCESSSIDVEYLRPYEIDSSAPRLPAADTPAPTVTTAPPAMPTGTRPTDTPISTPTTTPAATATPTEPFGGVTPVATLTATDTATSTATNTPTATATPTEPFGGVTPIATLTATGTVTPTPMATSTPVLGTCKLGVEFHVFNQVRGGVGRIPVTLSVPQPGGVANVNCGPADQLVSISQDGRSAVCLTSRMFTGRGIYRNGQFNLNFTNFDCSGGATLTFSTRSEPAEATGDQRELNYCAYSRADDWVSNPTLGVCGESFRAISLPAGDFVGIGVPFKDVKRDVMAALPGTPTPTVTMTPGAEQETPEGVSPGTTAEPAIPTVPPGTPTVPAETPTPAPPPTPTPTPAPPPPPTTAPEAAPLPAVPIIGPTPTPRGGYVPQ